MRRSTRDSSRGATATSRTSTAAARREARGEPAQLYEQNEVQRALAVFYKDLEKHMRGDRVVVIPADGSIDDVHSRVLAAYDSMSPVLS